MEIKIFYLLYLHESVRRISIPLKVSSSTAKKGKNISIPSNNIRSIPLAILEVFIVFQVAAKYIYISHVPWSLSFFSFLCRWQSFSAYTAPLIDLRSRLTMIVNDRQNYRFVTLLSYKNMWMLTKVKEDKAVFALNFQIFIDNYLMFSF